MTGGHRGIDPGSHGPIVGIVADGAPGAAEVEISTAGDREGAIKAKAIATNQSWPGNGFCGDLQQVPAIGRTSRQNPDRVDSRSLRLWQSLVREGPGVDSVEPSAKNIIA